MDYSKSYTATFRLVVLDENWSEGDELGGVYGLTISRSVAGDAPLIESADIDADVPVPNETYVRAYLDAEQRGAVTSCPLGTFLLESSGGESGHGLERSDAELWSVLKPAEERRLAIGWHAPKGCSAAKKAGDLLSECVAAPVSVQDGSPTLAEHYVSDGGDSHLSAAWGILPAGWEIAIDGMGGVSVREAPSDAVAIQEGAVIGTVSESWDMAGVPNRVTVSDGAGHEATAVNDDPSSPTSTVARGRVIDGDSSGVRESGESLRAFAKRLLAEQSKVTRKCSYDREFDPAIVVGSLVTLPGKQGTWRVESQSLDCSRGVRVSETAVKEEATWL